MQRRICKEVMIIDIRCGIMSSCLFELFEYEGWSDEKVRTIYGKDIAENYMSWLYENVK